MSDYAFDVNGSLVRKSDNASIPIDGNNTDYQIFLATGQTPDPPAPDSPISLNDYAAAKRYDFEVSGVNIFGMNIATDRDSQSKIIGGYVAALHNPGWSTEWKTVDGAFVNVNALAMQQLALAVMTHVSNAYKIEADVNGKLISGEITSTAQIDAAFA